MGMYTEFYFRANIKDGPVADWLDGHINGEKWFEDGSEFDDHPYFRSDRWSHVFIGGGAVYQESRKAVFRLKGANGYEPYRNELVLASSMKNYGSEIESFIDWIAPHLDMHYGDFLGYSLYEDSCDDSDAFRENPHLFFYGRDSVRA